MHRSSDLTDEPSRFKQFAWEQWENQPFAVLFRYVQLEEVKITKYRSKFFEYCSQALSIRHVCNLQINFNMLYFV